MTNRKTLLRAIKDRGVVEDNIQILKDTHKMKRVMYLILNLVRFFVLVSCLVRTLTIIILHNFASSTLADFLPLIIYPFSVSPSTHISSLDS